MRLTRYTDYALRLLIHLAAQDGKLCSIAEISRVHRVSQNHLMKVAHDLGRAGYIRAERGRLGGLRLARAAGEINVGEVVRHTEEGFELADCASCVIVSACGLTGALAQAVRAFMTVLDGYTLADLAASRSKLKRLLA
jgi:Rrf2 family nitric oxide-sensitive transcriptional repressor